MSSFIQNITRVIPTEDIFIITPECVDHCARYQYAAVNNQVVQFFLFKLVMGFALIYMMNNQHQRWCENWLPSLIIANFLCDISFIVWAVLL